LSAKREVEAAKTRSAGKKRAAQTPIGRTSRSNAVIKKMSESPEDAFGVFNDQSTPVKRQAIEQLSRNTVDLEELRRSIQDAPSAISVLRQFNNKTMNQAFVERVLSSKEVAESGSIAPRAKGFDHLGDRSKNNISTVQMLLPPMTNPRRMPPILLSPLLNS